MKKKVKKPPKKKSIGEVNIKRNRKEAKQQRYNVNFMGIGVG